MNAFFKELYTADPSTERSIHELYFPPLTKHEAASLNREVCEGEIYRAMFQLGAHKAPGIDGFSSIFFQYNWDLLGDSVTCFIKEAFRAKQFPIEMNRTIITLIPKVGAPEYVSQFRPIALMDVLIKLLTKVVANRLKVVAAKLVSETQCSFILGRQTSDNIVIVQEILHSMRRMNGRTGAMAIKIDLEKAYDRISWPYLTKVLHAVGFNADMVELIMFVVSSAKMQVLWNDSYLEEFQPTRGLRQGDPLAPLLFVLCMEHLTQLIQKSVRAGQWMCIRASRNGPPVSHLLFADDLFLFGKATEKQARVMAGCLEEFCRVSGQKINTAKSLLYVSKNVETGLANRMSSLFGVPITPNLGTYLGMPVLHGRVCKSTYSYLVEKVKKRLASWKGRLLSRAARHILVQSVTSTIPLYAMQTSLLPMEITNQLELANRKFFWGDFGDTKKLHTIAWRQVCKPKEAGGTGIKRLRQMNLALLAKLAWKLIQGDSSLWVRVLLAKYGNIWSTRAHRKDCTHTWRSIMAATPLIAAGVDIKHDGISSEGAPHFELIWNGTSNGKFTVASAYRMQLSESDKKTDTPWRAIWKLRGPQRDNLLLWQARLGRLPTGELLYFRHLRNIPTCGVCRQSTDCCLHALRDCWAAKRVWDQLITAPFRQTFFSNCTDVAGWVDTNLGPEMVGNATRGEWAYVFREAVATIWFLRNKKLHDEEFVQPEAHTTTQHIFERARNFRLAWDRLAHFDSPL